MNDVDLSRHVVPAIIAVTYLLGIHVARRLLIRQSAGTLVAYVERLRSAYGLDDSADKRICDQLARAEQASREHSEDLVLEGWRLAHGTEPLLTYKLVGEQIVARLVVLGHELAKSSVEGRAELGRRMLEAVRTGPGEAPTVDQATLQALLSEGLAQTYDARDDYFDSLIQENRRTTWLTSVGLLGVVGLTLVFGRPEFLLMGAVGGLFSRLAQVLRRRPEPTDYGVSWGPLMLAPVAGALAGWIGILVLAALAMAGLSPLSEQLTPIWDQPARPTELALAFLLGFSERFLQRILTSGTERLAPPPEAQPVATGGIQREPSARRRPR
ncbi:MAG: hypothetical protein M3198_06270 [Actinomycetota bacterium]|nr:hypothetical protein [Actinomycetota bacterium]